MIFWRAYLRRQRRDTKEALKEFIPQNASIDYLGIDEESEFEEDFS